MNLQGITFSGVDESVDPRMLALVSQAFPFVEWGVLFRGHMNAGIPRYPDDRYRRRLAKVARQTPEMKLSLHLCKVAARAFVDFGDGFLRKDDLDLYRRCDRIQINSLGLTRLQVGDGYLQCLKGLFGSGGKKIIIQRSSEIGKNILGEELYIQSRTVLERSTVSARGGLCVLWDDSGGSGFEIQRLASTVVGMASTGYAGGINADNVRSILDRIDRKNTYSPKGAIYIDMESGVRTDDKFDLRKCLRVIAQCLPYLDT